MTTSRKSEVKPLIQALEDENSNVRKEAADTLGKIRNKGIVKSTIP